MWIWIVDRGYLGKPLPDGFIALLRGERYSQSKDKYNSLFIVYCVSCIQVIMLLEFLVYTYIYIAYMLALPTSMTVHNVFHISFLKKYIPDANHVINCNVIQVEQEGVLQVHPVRILDRKRKNLWNQTIGLVKV
jgi:hypothetical protein